MSAASEPQILGPSRAGTPSWDPMFYVGPSGFVVNEDALLPKPKRSRGQWRIHSNVHLTTEGEPYCYRVDVTFHYHHRGRKLLFGLETAGDLDGETKTETSVYAPKRDAFLSYRRLGDGGS